MSIVEGGSGAAAGGAGSRRSRALAIDGDNIANLRQPAEGYDRVVVFMNLRSATHPDWVREVDQLAPHEVVVCDDWAESADLAMLAWMEQVKGACSVTVRTQDRGLRRASDAGVAPNGAAWRLTFGGTGMQPLPTAPFADARAALTAVVGPRGASALTDTPGTSPWWSRMAAAARPEARARLALPLGLSSASLAPELGGSLQGVFAGASARFEGSWQIPEPPVPLSSAHAFAIVRAVPGLIQIRTENAASQGYDWTRLRLHCPEVVTRAAPELPQFRATPGVPADPEAMATSVAALRRPAPCRAAALLVSAARYRDPETDAPQTRIGFKRLDFTRFPSDEQRSSDIPSFALRRLLRLPPADARTLRGQVLLRQLELLLDPVFERLQEPAVLRDVLLLPRRRAGAWHWFPALLGAGERLRLPRQPEVVDTSSPRSPRVGLVRVPCPRTPPNHVVAVVTEPRSLAYLATAQRWPVEVEVARVVSTVLYEVRVRGA
jgi:hypothetical protein